MAQIKPAQILKALEKGPLTWRLLNIELGFLVYNTEAWSSWTLPDRCPACNGSGKTAGHPYRDGLKVVK